MTNTAFNRLNTNMNVIGIFNIIFITCDKRPGVSSRWHMKDKVLENIVPVNEFDPLLQ